ncbi:MAG: hypothetical protein OEY59_08310 [Deltaproteobacteria bacterium]|nr:hypothetical protein [Deltaproteobacteria bacterium]
MENENCHLCQEPLKKGQSFYEDHGVKVCLNCFRVKPRCHKCKFPSESLTQATGVGLVCEFCLPGLSKIDVSVCYLCGVEILQTMSHYADHGQVVCQNCFKDAKIRCFFCRFPKTQDFVNGLGGVCEFCEKSLLHPGLGLEKTIAPLGPFLGSFQHKISLPLQFNSMGWNELLLVQMGESGVENKIRFFDELILHCYPVFYFEGKINMIPKIQGEWFLPVSASQLVASDLCQKYDLPHLLGNGPFQQLARGWCHWIGYCTAKTLKYNSVEKKLCRHPENGLMGSFSKFHAMMEFRSMKEILEFGHENLKNFAGKYL